MLSIIMYYYSPAMANVQRSISDPDFTSVLSHAETIEFDGVHETPLRLVVDNVVPHPLLPSRPPSEFQSRAPSVNEQVQQQIFTSRRADRLRELMLKLNQFGYDGAASKCVVLVASRAWA